jgi:hypothetical protein
VANDLAWVRIGPALGAVFLVWEVIDQSRFPVKLSVLELAGTAPVLAGTVLVSAGIVLARAETFLALVVTDR